MKINGNVIFDKNEDYSKVVEITGSLYCRGFDTKAAFPVLTSVGGSLYCSGSDTKSAFLLNVKFNDLSCPAVSRCAAALMASFLSVGILFADGISSKIISKRNKSNMTIYSVIIVGKNDRSIVIEQHGAFSHGKTISDAVESLIYKISDRDTSIFNNWNVDTEVLLSDAIKSYRAITGACEQGTRNFCKSQGELKEKYTVKEIIALTKGAFGSEEYAKFFKG